MKYLIIALLFCACNNNDKPKDEIQLTEEELAKVNAEPQKFNIDSAGGVDKIEEKITACNYVVQFYKLNKKVKSPSDLQSIAQTLTLERLKTFTIDASCATQPSVRTSLYYSVEDYHTDRFKKAVIVYDFTPPHGTSVTINKEML